MSPTVPAFQSFPVEALKTFPAFLSKLPVQAPLGIFKYYASASPLHGAFLLCSWNILWTFILGEITGNVSQVDRVWNFLPPIYGLHFLLHPLLSMTTNSLRKLTFSEAVSLLDKHALAAVSLQLLWSLRLGFNAWRRGFFDFKSEDYRWPIARKYLPGILFNIFNLVFIAVIQNILLLGLSLPIWVLNVQAHPSVYGVPKLPAIISNALATSPYLGIGDFVLIGFGLSLLVGEYIADGQQYAYQEWKHSFNGQDKEDEEEVLNWKGMFGTGLGACQWKKADRKRGFGTRGLWAWSRHPAFACEQTFWFNQAFFPLLPVFGSLFASPPTSLSDLKAISKDFPWWVLAAPLSLHCLFIGSTLLTEAITSPKYPLYKKYQQRVGFFWPLGTFIRGLILSLRGKKAEIEKDLGWKDKTE